MNDAPKFNPSNRADWRAWLHANHASANGVWLVWHKKHTGRTELSYDDMVEEALCYGWIDSVPRRIDEDLTSLYFSPRKPKSEWSAPNKKRVKQMLESGQMTAAGQRSIDIAKQNGAWDTLQHSDALNVPDDLLDALDAHPPARTNFDAFPPGARKNILAWIYSAKTEATRTKRVQQTSELAAQNIRANQWRPSK